MAFAFKKSKPEKQIVLCYNTVCRNKQFFAYGTPIIVRAGTAHDILRYSEGENRECYCWSAVATNLIKNHQGKVKTHVCRPTSDESVFSRLNNTGTHQIVFYQGPLFKVVFGSLYLKPFFIFPYHFVCQS